MLKTRTSSTGVAAGVVAVMVALCCQLPTALGQRTTDGLVMLYDFQEGWGDTVHDSSTFGAPIDLKIQEPERVAWGPGSLSVNANTIMVSFVPARKLFDASVATNEFTIEAWIQPALLDQSGPARIVSYSQPTSDAANFTLGQDGGEYQMRLRTSTTGAKGRPRRLLTSGGQVKLELTHLVYTFESSGQARFYIDGQVSPLTDGGNFVGDGLVGGNFTDPGHRDLPEPTGRGAHNGWTDNYTLNLANEDDLGLGDRSDVDFRPWLGTYYLTAVYSRALTADEVLRHFAAGPCPASDVEPEVAHLRTDPIVLSARDLPTDVQINVALAEPNTGTVTVTSSDATVVGGGNIDFAADGSTCGSTTITVTGTGTSSLELSNDMGLVNGSARRVIVIDAIDLGDIVSAGDGKGNKLPIFNELLNDPAFLAEIIGIEQDLGLFQVDRLSDSDPGNEEVADTDGNNPVVMDGTNDTDNSPWIDSVFVLNADSMPISSAGVTFDFEPGDANESGWDQILDGLEPGGPFRLQIGRYNTADGVGIHASSGITYNLDELRATHGDAAVQFVSAGAGEAIGAPGTEGAGVGGTVNNYLILSDDTSILSSAKLGPHTDGGEFIELEIPSQAKFLTLAVGDAGDGIGDGIDRGVFLDAFITSESILARIETFTVNADQATLAVGESTTVRVIRSFAGRGDLSASQVAADSFDSDNPGVATVDANGLATAVGGGTATISATVGGQVVGGVRLLVQTGGPALVSIVDGLGGVNAATGLADTFISPLGENCAFTEFGLDATEAVTLDAVTPTYTAGGAAPTVGLVSNGGGNHTVTLSEALAPGHWLKLELAVTGQTSGQSATITVWVAHQPLDINQDAETNIRDATAFGEVFTNGQNEQLIDTNCDDTVNIRDATEFGNNWNGLAPNSQPWRNTSLPPKP